MDYQDAVEALNDADWFPADEAKRWTGMAGAVLGDLFTLEELAKRGALPDEEAAAIWYALVQRLRYQADFYERSLVRHLRWGNDGAVDRKPRAWAAIADLIDGNLGSRQAAWQKWQRLLADDRREYGGAGRGGWTKGKPRSQ